MRESGWIISNDIDPLESRVSIEDRKILERSIIPLGRCINHSWRVVVVPGTSSFKLVCEIFAVRAAPPALWSVILPLDDMDDVPKHGTKTSLETLVPAGAYGADGGRPSEPRRTGTLAASDHFSVEAMSEWRWYSEPSVITTYPGPSFRGISSVAARAAPVAPVAPVAAAASAAAAAGGGALTPPTVAVGWKKELFCSTDSHVPTGRAGMECRIFRGSDATALFGTYGTPRL